MRLVSSFVIRHSSFAFFVLRIACRVSRMGVTVNRTPAQVLAPNERNERNERKSCTEARFLGSETTWPCPFWGFWAISAAQENRSTKLKAQSSK
jgi:hypothetical protein